MLSFFHLILRGWRILLITGLLVPVPQAYAAGLYRDGADARSAALGGAEVAQSGSALAALDANPAALATMTRPGAEVNLAGGSLSGKFTEADGSDAHFHQGGFLPAAALELPAPHHFPIRFGFGLIPEIAGQTDWRYRDAPGGLGGTTSYGEQTYRSHILALRLSLAVAVPVTRWLAVGASAGLIYNENSLHAPYIFQSQPVLAGFKTRLDLDVSGVGASFQIGAQIRPSRSVTLGVSYRPSTVIDGDGHASGNASAQLQALGGGFAQVDPRFRYDAEVRTEMPQIVETGVEWQALARLRLAAGVDWIGWSDAFDQLKIHLKNGSNPAINSVVGSAAMTDLSPLRWRDQFVYRVGAEYAVSPAFALRAGYSYARSAVPDDTLTPLTAAIFEHTLTAGAGYKTGRYHLDLAWQWNLPVVQHVGVSGLRSGEYSQTSVLVSAQSLQLTTGVDF